MVHVNIAKKNTLLLFFSYFSISALAFLIYPLTENIDYINQIKDGFLFMVYILPMYSFIKNISDIFACLDFFDFKYFLFSLLIVSGNIIPIILIYKYKKLFPFVIISIISFSIYIFIGIMFFGIRNGEF
jgi:hypothetical protein